MRYESKVPISLYCVAYNYGLFENLFAPTNCGLFRNVLLHLLHHLRGAKVGVEQSHEATDVEHVYSAFDCLWQQLFQHDGCHGDWLSQPIYLFLWHFLVSHDSLWMPGFLYSHFHHQVM